MDYKNLTDQQRAQQIQQRITQTEADHYQFALNLGAAEAIGNDDAAKQAKDQIEQAEKLLTYYRAQAKDLPKVEQPQGPGAPVRPG